MKIGIWRKGEANESALKSFLSFPKPFSSVWYFGEKGLGRMPEAQAWHFYELSPHLIIKIRLIVITGNYIIIFFITFT